MKERIKKSKMFPVLLELFLDVQYIFLNYLVNHIPCWNIRKPFYLLFGMKLGKGSRIYMGTKILMPNKIVMGDHCIINEYCFLDGRGGLKIGNNVSISIYSIILTGKHDKDSSVFAYESKPVEIGNCVWIGARAMVLDGSYLGDRCIIGAGSVFKGKADPNGIYFGIPAKKSGERKLNTNYTLTYKPFFR